MYMYIYCDINFSHGLQIWVIITYIDVHKTLYVPSFYQKHSLAESLVLPFSKIIVRLLLIKLHAFYYKKNRNNFHYSVQNVCRIAKLNYHLKMYYINNNLKNTYQNINIRIKLHKHTKHLKNLNRNFRK